MHKKILVLFFIYICLFSANTYSQVKCELDEIKGGFDTDIRKQIKEKLDYDLKNLRQSIKNAEKYLGPLGKATASLSHLTSEDIKRLYRVVDTYYKFSKKCHDYYLTYGKLLYEALALLYDSKGDAWIQSMEKDCDKARRTIAILFAAKHCSKSREIAILYKEKFALLKNTRWRKMTEQLDDLDKDVEKLKAAKIIPAKVQASKSFYYKRPPKLIQEKELKPVEQGEQGNVLAKINKKIAPLKIDPENFKIKKKNNTYTLQGKIKLSINSRGAKDFYLLFSGNNDEFISIDINKMKLKGQGLLKLCTPFKEFTLFKKSFEFSIFKSTKALDALKEVAQKATKKLKEMNRLYKAKEAKLKSIQGLPIDSGFKNAFKSILSLRKKQTSLIKYLDDIKNKISEQSIFLDLRKTKLKEYLSEIKIGKSQISIETITLTPNNLIITGNTVLNLQSVGVKVQLTALTIGRSGVFAHSIASIEKISLGFCRLEQLFFEFIIGYDKAKGKFKLRIHKARGNIKIKHIGGLKLEHLAFKDGKLDTLLLGCVIPQGLKVPIIATPPIFLRRAFGGVRGLRSPPMSIHAGVGIELGDSTVVEIRRIELIIQFGKNASITGRVSDLYILKRKVDTDVTLIFSKKGFYGNISWALNSPIGLLKFEGTLAWFSGGRYFIRVKYSLDIKPGEAFGKKLNKKIKEKLGTKIPKWVKPEKVMSIISKALLVKNININLEGMIWKGPNVRIVGNLNCETVLISLRLHLAFYYKDGKIRIKARFSINAEKFIKKVKKFVKELIKEKFERFRKKIKKAVDKAKRVVKKYGGKVKKFFKKLGF